MITRKELEEMRSVDPRTVDRSTLVDIDTVKIDQSLPKKERIEAYIRQVKNPYCYLQNGVVVKISFADKESLEDCIKRCISQAI
ncbi:MAG: hypothetical protein Q4C61_03505 [Lachnospiraceae bacterium]|nr:hypothetical protein [Lachnospiraceae bacterium]